MTTPYDASQYTISEVRQRVLAVLQSIVGLTANDDEYLQLIDPGDPRQKEQGWAKASDCMLVALGVQDRVFDLPPRGPYVPGSAPRLLEQRAGGSPMSPALAFRVPGSAADSPTFGDLLWWGQSGSACEHVEHLVAIGATSTEFRIEAVAGGERTPAGVETILRVVRTVEFRSGRWVDTQNGRPLVGFVDADLLAARFSLR